MVMYGITYIVCILVMFIIAQNFSYSGGGRASGQILNKFFLIFAHSVSLFLQSFFFFFFLLKISHHTVLRH